MILERWTLTIQFYPSIIHARNRGTESHLHSSIEEHAVTADSSPPAYQEIHEDGYEELAAKTFSAQFVPNSANPSDIYLSGPCPRCKQAMTFRHPILIVRGIDEFDEATVEAMWELMRQRGSAPTEWSFNVYCLCRVVHDNAPEGAEGCGALWGMTVAKPQEVTR